MRLVYLSGLKPKPLDDNPLPTRGKRLSAILGPTAFLSSCPESHLGAPWKDA